MVLAVIPSHAGVGFGEPHLDALLEYALNQAGHSGSATSKDVFNDTCVLLHTLQQACKQCRKVLHGCHKRVGICHRCLGAGFSCQDAPVTEHGSRCNVPLQGGQGLGLKVCFLLLCVGVAATLLCDI